MVSTHIHMGMGQNQPTKKTAGFGPCFYLPGIHFGLASLLAKAQQKLDLPKESTCGWVSPTKWYLPQNGTIGFDNHIHLPRASRPSWGEGMARLLRRPRTTTPEILANPVGSSGSQRARLKEKAEQKKTAFCFVLFGEIKGKLEPSFG